MSGLRSGCAPVCSVRTRSSRSTYWPRWRGPRNASRTRACAAWPIRSASWGSSSSALTRAPKAAQVMRLDQVAGPPVVDLVLDAADARGDDRPRLPHRLGDREAEPFRQALLRDDVGAPLERVDDDRVLVEIVHRQQREVHAPPDAPRQLAPGRLDLRQHLGSLGVVGHRRDVGSGQHQVRLLLGVDVLGEPGEHAQRVLEPVPARHLREQRACRAAAAPPRSCVARRSTRPTLPSSRSNTARPPSWWSAARPAARSTAVTLVNAIAWFFGAKASIDGGMTITRSASSPGQR